MKREELTAAVREAASGEGYTFYSGDAGRMNGTIRVYPAAWLEPPVLKSSEGRNEGTSTYRLTVHFMALPSASGESETLRVSLEEDALAAIRAVGVDSDVTEISNISCTVARQPLTAHGETSVTLICDVTMWFYV